MVLRADDRVGWRYVALVVVSGISRCRSCSCCSRDLKKKAALLAKVAIGILAMRLVDLIWLVAPNFEHHGFPFSWMDVAIPVGLGGHLGVPVRATAAQPAAAAAQRSVLQGGVRA